MGTVSIESTLCSSRLQFLLQHSLTPIITSGGGELDSEPSLNGLSSLSQTQEHSLFDQVIRFYIGTICSQDILFNKVCSNFTKSCKAFIRAFESTFIRVFSRIFDSASSKTLNKQAIASTICHLMHLHERRCA